MFSLLIALALATQQQPADNYVRRYDVHHNGRVRGSVEVIYKNYGGTSNMRIESDFNIPMLIQVSIRSVEEASFHNGILTSSSVDRRVNGREKMKQKLLASGESYRWHGRDERDTPSFPIRWSVLSLYFREPINQRTVFSDALGKTVSIREIKKGTYRLDLPNGNFNYYSYVKGVCTIIEIHHSLFKLQFVLKG